MALAVMLLAGAGLLLKSFARLTAVDPGFDPEGTLSFEVALPAAGYAEDARIADFYGRLLERMRALPGVRSAGAVNALPLSGGDFLITFDVEGRPAARPGEETAMQVRVATPDYFRAMGIPLLRGRGFMAHDRTGAPPVVLLSETAVQRWFPGEDPIGKRIKVGWTRYEVSTGGEVIGIVGDVKLMGLDQGSEPEIYLAHAQAPVGSVAVVVRSARDPLSLAAAVRREVAALDPSLPVAKVRTIAQLVSGSVSQPRFTMLLLALFAGAALVLAAVGIFGVMANGVARRTREIGIRMALGADRGAVLRGILAEALGLSLFGVVLGLTGALALTRLMAGLLFGVAPADPPTFAAVAATLVAVALLASWLPARVATRVDPVVALRTE